MLIVSKCLAGVPCRYDGKDNLVPEIKAIVERGEAVAVCPEVLGGLPTPRVPSEIQPDGRVLSKQGEDVTAQFVSGAARAMTLCRAHGCTGAILKARSPSCGKGVVYDGSFTGKRVPGSGVFVKMLLDAGIPVMTEEEYLVTACGKNETVLETERLILRPWKEADAGECFFYAKDPRVGPICGWPAHTSVEHTRQVIRDVLAAPETYAIVLRETGLPIGSIGLHRNDLAQKDDEAELGYWLGVPFWGRGIAPEAARALLRRAFEDLRLARVWCGYYDGNEQSKRVQEKLGFRYQWTTDGAPVPQMGETRKAHVSLLTKADWAAARDSCEGRQ